MYMIEISESNYEKMCELLEKVLRHGGKLMSMFDEMSYGQSENYRGGYGSRYENYRNDGDDDDYGMNERRRRSRSTGRYM